MDWLNLHLPTLRSAEFLGSDPVDRATWLCLMAFCVDQENGGVIEGCSEWGDRKWQQLVGVTREEVTDCAELWEWKDGALIVMFYPKEKEDLIKARREAGRKGGQSKSEAKTAAVRQNGNKGGRPQEPNGKQKPKQNQSNNQTEGEREVEEEVEVQSPPNAREGQVKRLLAVFNIDTPIERIGPEATRIFADPATAGFLDDEAFDTIRRKAPEWLAQDWIKDISPRFIAERLAEIYNFQPKAGTNGADRYANGF